jgi:transposase, IS30 family
MDMGRRGRKRRLGIEDEYWELILQGIGTVEACRLVGIGRKTGYRWRAERGGLPPLRRAEQDHGPRYLSFVERQRIMVLRSQGMSLREIGRRLGRAPSTISRELRRNTSAHDRGGYDAVLANARSRERARRAKTAKIALDRELREQVQHKLELEWSPEQIAGWLRQAFPQKPQWWLCHETIYQGLYRGPARGLSRRLTRKLRTARPMRKRRRRAHERTPRFIAASLLIDARPARALTREEVGDWEGDLIIGAGSRSAIGTLVDRHSRYLKLIHLPGDHTAPTVAAALRLAMGTEQTTARRTLTWDQGTEMAQHHLCADLFAEGIYFAHAGKPWQRGLNENTNGLLRQYFPKGTDLRRYPASELARVEHLLNNRPRKSLGFKTPAEVFATALSSS